MIHKQFCLRSGFIDQSLNLTFQIEDDDDDWETDPDYVNEMSEEQQR